MRAPALLALALMSLVIDADHASARKRGIFLIGAGTTVGHCADLEPELAAELREETGFAEPKLGYAYDYFAVFILFDLWTFEGTHVLYDDEGDRYIELDDAGLTQLGTSAEALGKPLLYRFPLGLWLILIGIAGVAGKTWWASRP